MKALGFQKKTAERILRRFKDGVSVVALADETGLGKTHVVVEVIAGLARRKTKRKPLVVYYVASNLVLADQNAEKLARHLSTALQNGSTKGDSLVWSVLPSEARTPLFRRPRSKKAKVLLFSITPETSLFLRGRGKKEERDWFKRQRSPGKKELSPLNKRNWVWRSLSHKRLLPDLIVFDEYQSYAGAVDWEETEPDAPSLAPRLIAKAKTLLVSATPFETTMADPSVEEPSRRRRHRLSFDLFARLLARYDGLETERLLSAKQAYEAAWQEMIGALQKKQGREAARGNLIRHRDDYHRAIGPHLLRQSRKGIPNVSIWPPRNEFGRGLPFLRDLVSIHAAASDAVGWRENASFFGSSPNFFELKDGGEPHYKLGRTLSSKALRRLRRAVEKAAPTFPKKGLLQVAQQRAGIDPAIPPLWVAPTDGPAGAEKILVFSNLIAAPREILATLPAEDKAGTWRLSKRDTVHQAIFNWIQPSRLLRDGDREDDANLDELGWDAIRRLVRRVKGREASMPTWAKVKEALENRKRNARLTQTPGAAVADALGIVLSRYRVPAYLLREAIEDPKLLKAFAKLHKGLDTYLGNERVVTVMKKALKIRGGQKTDIIQTYAKKFRWKAVWVEYWDRLLDEHQQFSSSGDLADALTRAALEAAGVLQLKAERRQPLGKGELIVSHIGAILGTPKEKDGETGNRPTAVREAFNSPFAPFILATTSIGEEGLDFHRYCRHEVHWDPPRSGMALAQRIGRVVRFRGLLQRRALATANRSGFVWRQAVQHRTDAKDSLLPDFDFDDKNGPTVTLFAPPYTKGRKQAEEVLQHYRDLKYFVGVSAEELKSMLKGLAHIDDREKRKYLAGCELHFW